jgi:hypothetical protein
MKKMLAAFAACALACASMLAPLAASPAEAQHVYGSLAVDDADTNAAAASKGDGVIYAQLTAASPSAIDGEVVVPWGDWLAELIAAAYAIILAVVLWLVRKAPKSVIDMVDSISRAMGQGGMNELLEKAITYGINVTAGAVRGKTMTIKTGNEVLERATEYALRHAPGLVKKYGGLETLREKIIARLDLDADAEVPAPRPPVASLLQSREPQAVTAPAPGPVA